MSAAVLSIGTEITRGEIVNTNAAWLSTELTSAGFSVGAVEAVPDEIEAIIEALRRLGSVHRILVVTGGLGPTTDDLTALAAARATGAELARDESTLLAIRRRLEARGLTMNPSNEKQADVPAGAEILPNPHGTAPGFALPIGSGTAFFLPGVPKEMKPMFTEMVMPRIRSSASNNAHQIVLHVYGLRESPKARMGPVAFHNHPQWRAEGRVRLFEGWGGWGAGEQSRDFVHVDDVVAVNLHFLDHPGVSGIFNVGTGRAQPFNDVASTVVNAHRALAGEHALPLAELVALGLVEYVPFPDALKGKYQSFTQADITRLRAAGYTAPFMSVQQGVRRYVDWLAARG